MTVVEIAEMEVSSTLSGGGGGGAAADCCFPYTISGRLFLLGGTRTFWAAKKEGGERACLLSLSASDFPHELVSFLPEAMAAAPRQNRRTGRSNGAIACASGEFGGLE